MIDPFEERLIRDGKISFGLSSYGYDVRLAPEFQLWARPSGTDVLDPKNVPADGFKTVRADHCIVPPRGLVLGRTVEYFRMPRQAIALCVGKSSYARIGLLVNVTPFEPQWEGFVTISMSNLTESPLKLYAGEGIAQVLFFASEDVCETSYADRKGKYQAQKEITHAKVEP